MPEPHSVEALERVAHDIRRLAHELHHFHLNPLRELETVMTIKTDLDALGVRVDAVTAVLPVDIAQAVATQKAADDAANAQNVQDLADATGAVADLTGKIAALETAAGIPATPTPEA